MNYWFSDAINPNNFDKNVEVAKRAYDGKFNLWRKVVELHEDGSWSQFWEVVGVFDEEREANTAKEDLRKKSGRKS